MLMKLLCLHPGDYLGNFGLGDNVSGGSHAVQRHEHTIVGAADEFGEAIPEGLERNTGGDF